MNKNEDGQSIAAKLPVLILRLIFSFISIEDLPRVQKVCSAWEDATQNALAWKNALLRLAYRKQYDYRYRYSVEYVARVSYLHTIIGNCLNADELFETLVENVIDLRKAKIFIKDYNSLSTVNFHNFIKKFKNLEYFVIDNNIPVVVESLHMLSNCPNLRSLYMCCTGNLENIKHMCNVIGNGFLALRNLKILHINSTTTDSTNAIFGLLNTKLNKLTHLNLIDDFRPYSELISKSTKLMKLKINALNCGRQPCLETPFNLGGMTGLKSLVLGAEHYTSRSHSPGCIPDAYRNIVFPKNLEHLFITLHTNQPTGLIRNIIKSLPNLRYLDIRDVDDADFDEQLEGINNLPNLHTVMFTCCKFLSVSGVEYIMNNCKGLRKLRIPGKSFTDSTFESLKNCVYLQELAFDGGDANVDKLLQVTMPLKYLTSIKGDGRCGIDKHGRPLCGYEVDSYIKQGRKKHYEMTANI